MACEKFVLTSVCQKLSRMVELSKIRVWAVGVTGYEMGKEKGVVLIDLQY